MIVFGKGGCIRAKMVLFSQKWLYSGKNVVLGHSCCIRTNVVVFG